MSGESKMIEELRRSLREVTNALNMCRLIMKDKEARDETGELVANARKVLERSERLREVSDGE